MDDKDKSELDQDMKLIEETLPLFWWSLYQGCLNVGFEQDEAFKIVLTYITTSCRKVD